MELVTELDSWRAAQILEIIQSDIQEVASVASPSVKLP